jgi:hypothetical protein
MPFGHQGKSRQYPEPEQMQKNHLLTHHRKSSGTAQLFEEFFE